MNIKFLFYDLLEIYFLLHLFLSFQKSVPNAKIGFSKAMQAGWVTMDKSCEGGPKVFKKVCLDYSGCVCVYLTDQFVQEQVCS